MGGRDCITVDGNEAAASVAYRVNEVIALYPITPSTPMGEYCDAWASATRPNLWGVVPSIQQMQSEAGVAGAVHGALQAGSLATTFTASQGLLLMIPNMYKIAGELTPTVFHVAARTVATHALSIFGDHSDVMAVRQTGWGILFSSSVQECADMAAIAHAATLKSRVPFVHAFDGFRTSHEISKIVPVTDDELRLMIDEGQVRSHRLRALTPDHPLLRGTAQNPDVFFQSREAVNPYYRACPDIVQRAMDQFARITGRRYRLFDYVGAPDAERVIVMMGSGCQTAEETVRAMAAQGGKIGLLKVRLYRPFPVRAFFETLPSSTKAIAVLDRTKEPGAGGEPLYKDVLAAMAESLANGLPFFRPTKVIGGRYGLASKELTPGMIKAVFEELGHAAPKNRFTLGIEDDVTKKSLEEDKSFHVESPRTFGAVFWGLGSDGTVGANKNSIKIVGEQTDNHAQGYFVYDSKKSGSVTVSHLRFGPDPIQSPYLIRRARFVGVHQFFLLSMHPVLESACPGASVLLNCPYPKDKAWEKLPAAVRREIMEKKLKVFIIDAYSLAKKAGLGGRINTIMQTAFFSISGVMPIEKAVGSIKEAIRKSYGKKGDAVVSMNLAAVDSALSGLSQLEVPDAVDLPAGAPMPRGTIFEEMIAGRGGELPVSAMPVDGTFPTGTSKVEKRDIAAEVPVWEESLCIQCGKCVVVCPHAAIRAKVYEPGLLAGAPSSFKQAEARFQDHPGCRYTLQVSTQDCTGCAVCVDVCPAKDRNDASRKALVMAAKQGTEERVNWDFFLGLPDLPRSKVLCDGAKNLQLVRPLFEFSGACAGCGETPYLKMLSQCFGDRTLVANATGCSSIYGGNLPTTPWTADADGRGPAWANSLFEDNAEFGLGFRLALDQKESQARRLLAQLREEIGHELTDNILHARQGTEKEISIQRERVGVLKNRLRDDRSALAQRLLLIADILVKKTVWIVGGDGWAYDIGFGGLDHALASGHDINVLVLDTEVYSNTGGQASKASPAGAVAKFAAAGKRAPKKDIARIFMTYGTVYVAQIALGANDSQAVLALREAEAYDGPSIVIAYSQCIEHGIDMAKGMRQQKLAVDSGHWPLFRYNPGLMAEGKRPFQLDSRAPTVPLKDYLYSENRYRLLLESDPAAAADILEDSQRRVLERWAQYEALAGKVPPTSQSVPAMGGPK